MLEKGKAKRNKTRRKTRKRTKDSSGPCGAARRKRAGEEVRRAEEWINRILARGDYATGRDREEG